MTTIDDMNAVVRTFLARRHDLNLTQGDVAQAARVSRQTVSDFENGRAAVALPTLVRLLASVGLELTTRELSARPTLDELADRYSDPEQAAAPSPTRRVRKRAR